MLLLASLLLGQLHQSGPIALALLPIAFGVQWLSDGRRGKTLQWRRPSHGEAAFVAAAAPPRYDAKQSQKKKTIQEEIACISGSRTPC